MDGIDCKLFDQHCQVYAGLVKQLVESSSVLSEWSELRSKLSEWLTDEPAYNLALPILTCQAVGGEPDIALPIAAGWLCLRRAAHLMDAVVDGDPGGVEMGSSHQSGLAAGLIFVGFQFLAETKDTLAFRRVFRQFSNAGLQSALGQSMFIASKGPSQQEDPLERYWQAVILKSGSIFRAGAAGGAAVISSREDWIDAMGDYGSALGVMLQVLDDCRDQIVDRKQRVGLPGLPVLLESLLSGTREKALPEAISLILLEWQRRAQQALSGLPKSPALEVLYEFPARILQLEATDLIQAK